MTLTHAAEFVAKHLKNKRYIFHQSFVLWWLWESGLESFVCAKSNFNLVLLIDVAFYFKCLWKYPTTVLCGPASNETHSRTAIRSLASMQCSTGSVVFEGASTWWAQSRTKRVLRDPVCGKKVGAWRFPQPQLKADSTAQLCWCCQPHPPPVHLLWATWAPMEGSRRISTLEEGVKGSGVSVQGSAWGFTFDLLSCTN